MVCLFYSYFYIHPRHCVGTCFACGMLKGIKQSSYISPLQLMRPWCEPQNVECRWIPKASGRYFKYRHCWVHSIKYLPWVFGAGSSWRLYWTLLWCLQLTKKYFTFLKCAPPVSTISSLCCVRRKIFLKKCLWKKNDGCRVELLSFEERSAHLRNRYQERTFSPPYFHKVD